VVAPSELKQREVAFARTSAAMPEPLRATRDVKTGEPLTPRNSTHAPLVARGEWVSLHLKDGGIELERRVQALQDADLGALVQVRAANGADVVSARVTASGHVEAAL
jgi:flagella basal body P-ring formation protein FlgA